MAQIGQMVNKNCHSKDPFTICTNQSHLMKLSQKAETTVNDRFQEIKHEFPSETFLTEN